MKRKQYASYANGMAKRFKYGIGGAMRLASRFRMRGSGSRTRTRNSRGAQYGNLTFQNDEAKIYRRHRAPKRVRRRLRKSFKRFAYMIDKTQGMMTTIIPKTSSYSITPTSGTDAQSAVGLTIYGYGSNNATVATNDNWWNGDIRYIFKTVTSSIASSTNASTILRFRSCVMNLSIENVTDNTAPASNIIIIDLYHVLARNDSRTVADGSGDPAVAWNDAINLEGGVVNQTVVAANTVDNVTPFDSPEFGTKWIVKGCRRIRLGNAQIFNTQMRDPGNYILRESDLLELTARKYQTEGWIIVYRNSMADPTTGVRYPASIKLNFSKTYHYTYTQNMFDSIGRSNII